MASQHTMIDNAGVALHVVDDGDRDADVVVLLHGITNSVAAWEWLVPHLASSHRVLRLDFRGHGRSDRAPGTYLYPSYMADAVAVCEQLAGKPAVVIGHSLGGGTAAMLSQQRPDLVRGIVLEDPALRPGDAIRENSLINAFATMRKSIPRLQERGISVADLAERLAASPSPTGPIFADLLFADGITAMASALLEVDAAVLDPVLEGRMEPGFDQTQTIPVPSLVLAADSKLPDAVVQPRDIELLRQHSPHTRTVVVDGAGHLIHDELAHRQVVLDEVLAFLAALPAGSR